MDLFSRIAAGELPSFKCAEDEQFYAFLDINPLVKGHTLVIPRREVDYIFDMEDDEIAAFQVFAKKVAVAIKRVCPCIKVGQAVLGLEVPHAHIHLISRRQPFFTFLPFYLFTFKQTSLPFSSAPRSQISLQAQTSLLFCR